MPCHLRKSQKTGKNTNRMTRELAARKVEHDANL